MITDCDFLIENSEAQFFCQDFVKAESIYYVSSKKFQKILTANTKKKILHTKSLTRGGGSKM